MPDKEIKHPQFYYSIKTVFPSVVPEYRFHHTRRWRADFAVVDKLILIEVEGGVWTQGRHTRGKGYTGDMEKYNAAQKMGFRVMRYTPQQAAECLADMEFLKKL